MNDALHLSQLNQVLFHGNKIYRHRLLCINYTSYDLQRDFDVINPRTPKRDIMMLSHLEAGEHSFCYAQVLGIFHTNIMYVGPGSRDFPLRHIKFLWVQWFEILQDHSTTLGWNQHSLDRVRFLPMAEEDAFRFVHPADVLRGCHIVSLFTDGRLHPDGVAMSRCAGNADDWKCYYINQ